MRVLGARELGQINEPRAYLMTLAQRVLYNFWRRKIEQAYMEALAALPEAAAPSPETRSLLLETLLEIDRRLHTLPQAARQALLLSQLDGLPPPTAPSSTCAPTPPSTSATTRPGACCASLPAKA